MILTWQRQDLAPGTSKPTKTYITVEARYKQCFHDYFEKLFAYAFTIVGDNAEAKDIVQSAFLKLWEKRGNIDVVVAGKAYLYTTVYHLSLNAIRNRKVRNHHLTLVVPQNSLTHHHAAEEKEIRDRIQKAIKTLPPRCREIFCRSRLEGKKYATIATELSISIKTVEVQMSKALCMLRQQLSDLAGICILFLFT